MRNLGIISESFEIAQYNFYNFLQMKINVVCAELEWTVVGISIVQESNLDVINVHLCPVKLKGVESTIAD